MKRRWRGAILTGVVLLLGTTAVNAQDGSPQPDRSEGKKVELPETEIEGTLHRPEIFFVLPQARDRTDEQVIRARLKREITRPVVKHWLEDTLLLE